MTDNDNKDPQITSDEMSKAFEKFHANQFGWELTRPEHYQDIRVAERFLVWLMAWRECHLQLSAELKQLRAERGWQDISTAPRNGTEINLALEMQWKEEARDKNEPRIGSGFYSAGAFWWDEKAKVWMNRLGHWINNPTHWMPLPDKLTDSAQREEGNCACF